MEEFLSFVLIIFGILQIILFFKIWQMTSDVAEILGIMKSKENKTIDIDKIKYLVGVGKETQAEGVLGEMADKLCSDIANNKIAKMDALKKAAELETKYKELGEEMPAYLVAIIDEYVKKWEK